MLVSVIYLIVFVGQWQYASSITWNQQGDAWYSGDWLINYSGGFVRRGLIGDLLSSAANDGEQLLQLAMLTQMALLALVLIGALVLFYFSPRTEAWLMVMLSPAFMLFPALNPIGGLRKEIFVIASLTLLGLGIRFGCLRLFSLLSLFLFALSAFSHEVTAMAVPAFLFLIWIGYRKELISRVWGIAWTTVALTISILTLIANFLFPGNSQITSQICSDLVDLGIRDAVCGGSIQYLSTTSTEAFSQASSMFPNSLVILTALALAALPIAAVGASPVIWRLYALSVVFLSPLFVFAIDYGRWIYLLTGLISIILLSTWTFFDFKFRKIPLIAVLAFVLLWSVEYTGASLSSPGIVRLVTFDYSSLF